MKGATVHRRYGLWWALGAACVAMSTSAPREVCADESGAAPAPAPPPADPIAWSAAWETAARGVTGADLSTAIPFGRFFADPVNLCDNINGCTSVSSAFMATQESQHAKAHPGWNDVHRLNVFVTLVPPASAAGTVIIEWVRSLATGRLLGADVITRNEKGLVVEDHQYYNQTTADGKAFALPPQLTPQPAQISAPGIVIVSPTSPVAGFWPYAPAPSGTASNATLGVSEVFERLDIGLLKYQQGAVPDFQQWAAAFPRASAAGSKAWWSGRAPKVVVQEFTLVTGGGNEKADTSPLPTPKQTTTFRGLDVIDFDLASGAPDSLGKPLRRKTYWNTQLASGS